MLFGREYNKYQQANIQKDGEEKEEACLQLVHARPF